jgi:hypothetical protein
MPAGEFLHAAGCLRLARCAVWISPEKAQCASILIPNSSTRRRMDGSDRWPYIVDTARKGGAETVESYKECVRIGLCRFMGLSPSASSTC